MQEAQKALGTPYLWGGTSLKRGVDCSGFAWRVYQKLGIPVPLSWFRAEVDPRRNPARLEQHGMKSVRQPQAGDVAVFGRKHVGIYVGSVGGRALYIGANHGGRHRAGRVDIMPADSVGIRPVYYRYQPWRGGSKKRSSTTPWRRE